MVRPAPARASCPAAQLARLRGRFLMTWMTERVIFVVREWIERRCSPDVVLQVNQHSADGCGSTSGLHSSSCSITRKPAVDTQSPTRRACDERNAQTVAGLHR